MKRTLEIVGAISAAATIFLFGMQFRDFFDPFTPTGNINPQTNEPEKPTEFKEADGELPRSLEVIEIEPKWYERHKSSDEKTWGVYLIFDQGKRLLVKESVFVQETALSVDRKKVAVFCHDSWINSEGNRSFDWSGHIRIIDTDGLNNQVHNLFYFLEAKNLVWTSNNTLRFEIIGFDADDHMAEPYRHFMFSRTNLFPSAGIFEFTFDTVNTLTDYRVYSALHKQPKAP